MDVQPEGQSLPPKPTSVVGQPPQSIPQVPQGPPSKQGDAAPKDPFADPDAKHYFVELWAGTGSSRFNFACKTDISAAMGAFVLAMKHQPDIHTFGVWRKSGPANDAAIEETVCFVAIHQMLRACSPSLATLTGKQIEVPAVPVVTPEAGFDELGKQLKDQKRRR